MDTAALDLPEPVLDADKWVRSRLAPNPGGKACVTLVALDYARRTAPGTAPIQVALYYTIAQYLGTNSSTGTAVGATLAIETFEQFTRAGAATIREHLRLMREDGLLWFADSKGGHRAANTYYLLFPLRDSEERQPRPRKKPRGASFDPATANTAATRTTPPQPQPVHPSPAPARPVHPSPAPARPVVTELPVVRDDEALFTPPQRAPHPDAKVTEIAAADPLEVAARAAQQAYHKAYVAACPATNPTVEMGIALKHLRAVAKLMKAQPKPPDGFTTRTDALIAYATWCGKHQKQAKYLQVPYVDWANNPQMRAQGTVFPGRSSRIEQAVAATSLSSFG